MQISARDVNDYRLLFTLSGNLSIGLVNELGFFLVMGILFNSLLTPDPIH